MKPGLFSALSLFAQRGSAFWRARTANERRGMIAASILLGLALLWSVALGPALGTLRSAESQHRELDSRLQTMRALAAEAARLQALPRVSADDGRRALQASVTQHLGSTTQLTVAGERATITLKNVPGEALAQWLVQARNNARAIPVDARLSLNPARTAWDGSVVLAMPPP